MFFSRLFGRTPAVRPTMELSVPGPGPVAAAPGSRLMTALATDPGCVREVNEDAVTVVRPDTEGGLDRGVLAVVCDGMGGHEAGEVASRLAIEAYVRCALDKAKDPHMLLARAMEAANAAVIEAAEREPRLKGMGTTCTALLLRNGLAYCAHVGDSRCYMFRDGELFLMTEDHSAVMELVRKGMLTLEEARHHPDKNVISRALGSVRNVPVTTWPTPLLVRPGDQFLVCSDGLYDMLSDNEIRDVMAVAAPQDACDSLVARARASGGFDNISVAILSMQSPATAPRATRVVELPA
jgi:protein phosphatase